MQFINTKAINQWFEQLSNDLQIELSLNYLNHSNIEMLSIQDIIIIYVKHYLR